MKSAIVAILFSFLFSATAFSQTPAQKMLAQLPDDVVTKNGMFSLYSNWKPNEHGRVNVFVVNRSDADVELDYGYGCPKFFLEAKNLDGRWERATVHYDETCGTGLGVYALKPGCFSVGQFSVAQNNGGDRKRIETEVKKLRGFMVLANMTKESREAKLAEIEQLESQLAEHVKSWAEREIRIRTVGKFKTSYGVSNPSHASVDLRQIANAKRDAMTIRTADLERLEAIITGKEIFEPLDTGMFPINPVREAIYSLGRDGDSIEHATAILQKFVAESKDQTLVNIAKNQLRSKRFNQ